jgi:hypothetical protein
MSLETINSELEALCGSELLVSHLDLTSQLIEQLEQLEDDELSIVPDLAQQWGKSIKNNLKQANTALNRFNKNCLERIDPIEIDHKLPKDDFTMSLIDNVIKLHLLHEGELNIDSAMVEEFEKKNTIIVDIHEGKLDSLIKWVNDNAKGSELEFMVHKLQFIQFYKSGNIFKAYEYGKHWFPKLLHTDESQLATVSKLMTSLLYSYNDNPYEIQYDLSELGIQFNKQFCSHIGFQVDSSLSMVILSSFIAFPFFDKYEKIKSMIQWSSKDELPFEVILPQRLKYHAIYICPVLKNETTKQNPAMALPCHHIISKQAMWKLSKNGGNFKCPYCPMTCLPSQCREVEFHIL